MLCFSLGDGKLTDLGEQTRNLWPGEQAVRLASSGSRAGLAAWPVPLLQTRALSAQ